jgi:hypothetical protein
MKFDFTKLFKKNGKKHIAKPIRLTTIWASLLVFAGILTFLLLAWDAFVYWEYVYKVQQPHNGTADGLELLERAKLESISSTIRKLDNFVESPTFDPAVREIFE